MNMLRLLLPVFVTSLHFIFPAIIFASVSADSPWPDYGGGAKNSHRSNLLGPSGPVETRWTYNIPLNNQWLTSQAALGVDGTIYFTSSFTTSDQTGILTALWPDGSLRWDDITSNRYFGSWPTITTTGQVVISWMSSSTNSDWIRSYDASTGEVNWQARTVFDTGPRGVAVDDNGNIYTPNNGNWFMSHAPDGTERWRVGGSGGTFNPVISSDGKIITGVGSSINAFESDGTISWTVQGPPNDFRHLAIDDAGNIYASDADHEDLMSVSSDGVINWVREGFGGAISIGPDGTVYTFDRDVLHAIDPSDGSDIWMKNVGPTSFETRLEGVTVDAAGNLFLANVAGLVLALSSSGEQLWEFDLAPDIEGLVYPGAPVIGEAGVLYVPGGSTGKFFALQLVPEPTTACLLLSALIASICLSQGRRLSQP